jgi:hypothetical protein
MCTQNDLQVVGGGECAELADNIISGTFITNIVMEPFQGLDAATNTGLGGRYCLALGCPGYLP